eukprot:298759-Pelagomonas_calceolata.AAC.2
MLCRILAARPHGRRFCVWKALIEKDASRRGVEPTPYPQLLAELQQLRASQGIFVVILLRGMSILAVLLGMFNSAEAKMKAASGTQLLACFVTGERLLLMRALERILT